MSLCTVVCILLLAAYVAINYYTQAYIHSRAVKTPIDEVKTSVIGYRNNLGLGWFCVRATCVSRWL